MILLPPSFRGGLAILTFGCLAVAVISVLNPPVHGSEAVESRYLTEAEALLSVGKPGEAVRLYLEEIKGTSGWQEKLALAGPLARAALADGSWPEVMADVETWSPGLTVWQRAVLESAFMQFTGDLRSSHRTLAAVKDEPYAGLFRPLLLNLAEQSGDGTEVLRLRRLAWQAQPDDRALRQSYWEALLKAGATPEWRIRLEAAPDDFAKETEFWRERLPRLRELGLLQEFAAAVEESWDAAEDWAPLFALAELRLYQNNPAAALEAFQRVFRLPETQVNQADASVLFRRLNLAFHNRHAAKYRIGQALGTYGGAAHRDFAFLGLRQDPSPASLEEARDAALQYWKELADWRNGSAVVEDVRQALEGFPVSLRILAYAVLNAPRQMVEEIERFAASGVVDNAAAEFSLLAINRNVLSTERFPDLVSRMSRLSEDLQGRFQPEFPEPARQRAERMSDQIKRRLGTFEEETETVEHVEGSREWLMQKLVASLNEENPEEAERWFARLDALEGVPAGMELMLVRAWSMRENGSEQAARWLARFLHDFQPPVREQDRPVSSPWRWRESMPYPPVNPFLPFDRFEPLQEAGGLASGPVLDALIARQTGPGAGLPEERRPAGYFLQSILLGWDNRREEAAEHLKEGALSTGDGNLAIMAAYAKAGRGDIRTAVRLLEGVPAVPKPIFLEARKLLFALAVYQKDADQAGSLAAEWAERELSTRDHLELATGLSEIGLQEEAMRFLKRVSPLALGQTELPQWRETRALVALANDQPGEAIALARVTLLDQPPLFFEDLSGEFRRGALRVLAKADGMDAHVRHLENVLERAPEAVSIHLLLGEAHDYLWREIVEADEALREFHRTSAVKHHGMAAGTLRRDGEMYFQFINWLVDRGLWLEASEAFDHLLTVDVVSGLLDHGLLYKTYQEAGRLEEILQFFEQWVSPDADSLDHFYGVQPTEHLLNPLGTIFAGQGKMDLALRAWAIGLRNNPVEFTEEMRMNFVKAALERGQTGEALAAVVDYVAEPMPDLVYFHYQPFSTSIPRWIGSCLASPDKSRAPVKRLEELVRAHGLAVELTAVAEKRWEESPKKPSLGIYTAWLAGRHTSEGERRWQQLKRDFPEDERGPMKRIWEETERLFDECAFIE